MCVKYCRLHLCQCVPVASCFCGLLNPTLQDFNFESAKKASGNVAGLCNWAAAMCTYHAVAKEVEPKIRTLRAAEGELAVAQREQAKAQDNLAQVHN